ncbi:MAG: hypothetical protein AAGM22_25845 [Acidobacteriota bacterium]
MELRPGEFGEDHWRRRGFGRRAAGWILGAAGLGAVWAGAAWVGADELVDPPLESQLNPGASVGAAGESVVVWSDLRSGSREIFGRRFDSAGQALGASFQVNTAVAGSQAYPRVALGDGGSFTVVWGSFSGNSDAGIRGRRFDDFGQPVGDEFQVHVGGPQQQRDPSITRLSGGDFIVSWFIRDSAVLARRLGATGVPVGGEWVVDGSGDDLNPSVVSNADNEVLVLWGRRGVGGVGAAGIGRLFNSSGTPLGSEIAFPTNNTNFVPTGAFSGERFLVTWVVGDSFGEVAARLLDSSGTAIGADFIVPDSRVAEVAAASDGAFQLIWRAPDGAGNGIFTRRVSSTGALLGEIQQLNSKVLGDQLEPAIGGDGNGNLAMVWRGPAGSGGNKPLGIYGCFDLPDAEIFADGFESGETSAWDAEVP